MGVRNRKRVGNRVKKPKKIKKGGAFSSDAAALRPTTASDHHTATAYHPLPSEKKDERGESIFVGKGKREKDNGKMRVFFPHSLYIAAHDPTQQPTNRPGSFPLSPTPPLFCFCTLLVTDCTPLASFCFISCILNSLAFFYRFFFEIHWFRSHIYHSFVI